MATSISALKLKTTELKRRLGDRVAERRRKKRDATEAAEMSLMDDHPLLRASTSDDSSSVKSNMMNYAIASSCIASNFSVEDDKKTDKVSELYRQKATQNATQIIFPVMCKRDIYLSPWKENSPAKIARSGIESRQVMSDLSNIEESDFSNVEEAATKGLPRYSLTGSMLCREMERGNILPGGTSAPQTMMSPQKPMGLPVNTIMASMLFRTLQKEESLSLQTVYGQHEQKGSKEIVPRTIHLLTPESSSRKVGELVPRTVTRGNSSSTISSITDHPSEKPDMRMIKASNNLLALLQSNNFAEFDKRAKLYEA